MAEYPTVATAGPGHIAACFQRDDGLRRGTLDEARRAARLSIASVCPPEGWTEQTLLPKNFQSLGSRGTNYIVGKVLLGTFAPDRPWVIQEVAEDIWYRQDIDPEVKQEAANALFLDDLLILATIESANYAHSQGDMLGFWSIQRQALTQIFVTGDLLQRLDSEYRLTNFRRDCYVTCRSDGGAVRYHVTVESKDPLELTDEQIAACKLDYNDLKDKPHYERCLPLYTMIDWQPRTKKWMITQELNGHKLEEPSEEPISPFFSIPFDLAPKANYGRGLIAQVDGDLSSFDFLCACTLDFAAAASRINPVLSPASELQPKDLEAPSGKVLVDHVENGIAKHIAMVQSGKLQDFEVVHRSKEMLRGDLGKSLGGVSDAVRQSERTTAFEVSEVTLEEATGSLGGFLAPVQDKMQLPLFYRARHQLRMEKRDGRPKLATVKDERIKVRVLSGIQALANTARANRTMKFAEVAKALDPKGVLFDEYINPEVLLDVLARKQGIYEPGIIRTPQERERRKQAAMQAQLQLEAGQQAIQSTGAIAEQAAAGATANGGTSNG